MTAYLKDQALFLRSRGYTIHEIAQELKCNEEDIFNIVSKGSYKIVTAEERAKMIALKEAGMSYSEIARVLGRSVTCVKNRIANPVKYKAPTNTKKLDDEKLDKLKKMYLKGKTNTYIASRLKISPVTVVSRAKSMGIYEPNKSRNVPLTFGEKFCIKLYRALKFDISEISEEVGRSYDMVADLLNEFKNEKE